MSGRGMNLRTNAYEGSLDDDLSSQVHRFSILKVLESVYANRCIFGANCSVIVMSRHQFLKIDTISIFLT